MAFKVEDGTGLADSNSYATYAELVAYATLRGLSYSGKTQPDWEKLLVRATDFVDRRWGPFFGGSLYVSTQALVFPRKNLVDLFGRSVAGVPQALKSATVEYALSLAGGELFVEPVVDDSGMQVQSKTEIVGPIEETVTFVSGGGNPIEARTVPQAESLLRPYLYGSGGTVRN